MSGDLAYYVDDRFPYPQGPGGPYVSFPGNPSLSNPPFPATSAAAVRAGAAAASAALPAPALHGIATGRWGVAARRPVEEVSFQNRWGTPLSFEVNGPLWSGSD